MNVDKVLEAFEKLATTFAGTSDPELKNTLRNLLEKYPFPAEMNRRQQWRRKQLESRCEQMQNAGQA